MIKKLLITILILSPLSYSHAQTILFPSRGGTGIGSVSAGDIGKCLAVSNNAPFAFTLGACSGGGGGSGTAVGWASTTLDINSIYFTGGSTGKVGIGTTAPANALQVEGVTAINTANSFTATVLSVKRNTTMDSGGTGTVALNIFGRAGQTADLFQIGATSATDDLLTFTAAGNLGIGSTSPYASLAITNTGTKPSFVVEDSTSPDTTPFIIDASGNVGIGTTTPTTKLQITDTGETIVSLNRNAGVADGTDVGSIRFMNLQNYNAGIQAVASGSNEDAAHLRFLTSSSGGSVTERMRITDSGSVGIGATSPHYKTEINGTLGFTYGSSYRRALSTSNFGYSSAWKALIIGATSTTYNVDDGANTISFGYDPSINSNSAFSGDGREIIFRNGQIFMTPNSTNDGWYKTLTLKDGNVGVGTTSPYAKIAITNTGTDPSFVVEDSTSPDTTPFIIDASGNVGIGTTNPFSKLQVGTPTGSFTTTLSNLVNIFGAYSSSNSRGTLTLGSTDAAAADVGPLLSFIGETGQSSSPYPFASIKGAKESGGTYNGYLAFFTTPTGSQLDREVMRINSSGNVGIGTTTPDIYSLGLTKHLTMSTNGASVSSASLAIAGGTTGRARLDLGNESILRAGVWGIDGSHLTFNTNTSNSGTTLTEVMRITSSGNVGIGTSTPSTKLSVWGTGSVLSIGDGTNTSTNMAIAGSRAYMGYDGTNAVLQGASGKGIEFNVNNGTFGSGTAVTIDTSGNVGIGSTSPYASLAITNTGTNPSFVVEDSTSPDTTPFEIDASGNVGMGTMFGTAPSAYDKISILGSGSAGKVYIGNSNYDFLIGNSISSNAQFRLLPYAGDIYFVNRNNPAVAATGAIFFRHEWSTGAGIQLDMTIGSDGNVSLGTSVSGASKLNVQGNLTVGSNFYNTAAPTNGMIIESALGIGTTSPGQALSVRGDILGNKIIGTSFTATSTAATSTFAGGVDLMTATVQQHVYPSFTYSTSTAWTGTTTIPLGVSWGSETWVGVKCYTDAGTVNVSFSDGSSKMNMLNASTTVGTFGFTTNNKFIDSEKRYVDVGTPASSPTKISCTIDKITNI